MTDTNNTPTRDNFGEGFAVGAVAALFAVVFVLLAIFWFTNRGGEEYPTYMDGYIEGKEQGAYRACLRFQRILELHDHEEVLHCSIP